MNVNRFSECHNSSTWLKKERGSPYNIDLSSFTNAEPADRKDQDIENQSSNSNI